MNTLLVGLCSLGGARRTGDLVLAPFLKEPGVFTATPPSVTLR